MAKQREIKPKKHHKTTDLTPTRHQSQPPSILELQRIVGNRQTVALINQQPIQRFYVEDIDESSGYTWLDNSEWDASRFELSPKSKLMNGWIFSNLYRRKQAPSPIKIEPEPKTKPLQDDPTPKIEPKQDSNKNELEVVNLDKQEIKEEQQLEPQDEIFDGTVFFSSSDFYVDDPIHGKLKVESGDFKLAEDTAIKYKVVQKNKYYSCAVVTHAGPRPESKSTNQNINEIKRIRTEAVQKNNFINPNTINIYNSARKHYYDNNAIATTDVELLNIVSNNVQSNTYSVSPSSKYPDTQDQFTIPQPGNKMSIIGIIEYTDDTKTAVDKTFIFHVGPGG